MQAKSFKGLAGSIGVVVAMAKLDSNGRERGVN
jgi:hypothetical protein